jgi:hypothetical protein
MNANRRLEEFILKLAIRENDDRLFNIINEIKLKSNHNEIAISINNFISEQIIKYNTIIDKQ